MRGDRDQLVSVAIIATGVPEQDTLAAKAALEFVKSAFDFFEVALFVRVSDFEKHRKQYEDVVHSRNVRCVVLRDGVGDYRTAVVAATQTIGDFVFVIHADEFELINFETMYDAIVEHGRSVALRFNRRIGLSGRVMGRLLSATSGYHVDPTLLRSAVHSRTHIGEIAARADREVALRFMPRGEQRGSDLYVLDVQRKGKAPRSSLKSGIGHSLEIFSNSPPSFYRLMALFSFAITFFAVGFAAYAVSLLLIGVDLQPGWLTTSLAISGSAAFMSLALAGIFSALHQILSLLRDDYGNEIVQDLSNIDLFREFRRLNIEPSADP